MNINYYRLRTIIKRLGIGLHLIHPPQLPLTTPIKPLMGLCARYHGDDDGSPTNLVIRVAVENADQLKTALATGAKVIALVETCDTNIVNRITTIAGSNPTNLVAIELGNEIDLTDLSASDFNKFLVGEIGYLRAAGYRGNIITGSISRVRPDTLDWLKVAINGLQNDVLVGIHRYSINNDASIPQDGYVNRDEECLAILDAVAGRKITVTEFGYPLLDNYSELDYAKVRSSIQVDIDYWSRVGAKHLIYYQWLCGPTNTSIDRFGLKRPSGSIVNLDLLQ